MDDFANLLERDYGLKPHGKLAPMSSSSTSVKPASFSGPGNGANRRSPAPVFSDDDPFFGANGARSSSTSGRHNSFSGSDLLGGGYDDVFGGPPKFGSSQASASSSYNFEDIFRSASQKPPPPSTSNKASSYPVFDAPVYDDDIFGGMPGIRSADSAYEDVFNIGSTGGAAKSSASYGDLLGGFGSTEAKDTNANTDAKPSYDSPLAGASAFDDLLPGFGGAAQASQPPGDRKNIPRSAGSADNLMTDPFAVFESDSATRTSPVASMSANTDVFEAPADNYGSIRRKDVFDGTGPSEDVSQMDFEVPEFTKSSSAAEGDSTRKSADVPSPSPIQASESMDSNTQAEERVAKERKRTPPNRVKSEESMSTSSAESVSAGSPSHKNKPTRSTPADNPSESRQAFREPAPSPSHGRGEAAVRSSKVGRDVSVNEFWLSVEDVRLVTQPTEAPPPMRPPPVPGFKQGDVQRSSPTQKFEANHESDNGVYMPHESSKEAHVEEPNAMLDELEEFASASFRMRSQNIDGSSFPFEEDQGSAAASASGAAMKEAIERAEAKLREAKEAKFRDKEEARGVRVNEVRDARDKEEEREAKARHDRERDREAHDGRRREREKEERERQKEREREEKESLKERERELEKEKEREREREKDRADEIARQKAAVQRATAEVRDREAQKAAERAAEARAKAERAAVERATAEARQRHERTALERARAAERAATEAREKAERERAVAAAAREKAERERLAAAAAAAAREQQQSNGDDLESFFKSTSRPTSAPKQRTQATSTFSAAQQSSEGQWKSSGAVSNVKKMPSMPTMTDDLTSLFGGAPSNLGAFREIEGEPADRRKARWERHLRMLDRAAKALGEKHERDLQSARDQEDRHRAGQIVDAEIKRWAAGKEGNLRALLSTLQYVLWPECGWQAVSLTDLITAAAVKKVHRKATLCVHPDKVQQKGATNQQKYIAEKVFDLLMEAWNKFNSEELF